MLRSLVLILLIVNLAFYSWSQGWLNQIVGVRPDAQHEPQRLSLQVAADKITVLTPDVVSASAANKVVNPHAETASDAASATASSPDEHASTAQASSSAPSVATATTATSLSSKVATLCIEAGPFNNGDIGAIETALKPILPRSGWGTETAVTPGIWLVYMGPYTDGDMFARKQAELKRIRGLNFEEVHSPANLAQGYSLGRFTRLEDAEASLNSMKMRGIRSARIVNLRPKAEQQMVRVPQATERMQVGLAGVKLPQGKAFTACRS
jgi:hypothetical protein